VVHDHPAAPSWTDNERTAATGCGSDSCCSVICQVGSDESPIDWFVRDSPWWVGGHRDTDVSARARDGTD